MTSPYDETREPGREPVDPWAEDDAQREQEQDRWSSQSGGLGPIPSRTWSRGNSSVVIGGCCLPLPLGCLVTVLGAGALAAVGIARSRS